jgi:hypothetical protein
MIIVIITSHYYAFIIRALVCGLRNSYSPQLNLINNYYWLIRNILDIKVEFLLFIITTIVNLLLFE